MWASENQFVVITNDLDSSAIRAATSGQAPSVGQIRTQDLLSEAAVSAVARALEAHRQEVETGAVLSIDEGGTRVRMLPPPSFARSDVAAAERPCGTKRLTLRGAATSEALGISPDDIAARYRMTSLTGEATRDTTCHGRLT